MAQQYTTEPAEHLDGIVVRGLVERLQVPGLLTRLPERLVWTVFVVVNGFVTIAVLAGIAMISKTPFIFPSLGPTAFMFFFNPRSPSATPRNAVLGHAVGIVCGYGALLITGLQSAPPATVTGVHDPRVLAAALSLSATGALMILFVVPHPPAGATTLIVSLGFITRPEHLVIIEAAVVALTLQAFAVNRAAGIKYPIWNTPT